ncbi:MAG TPA: ferredoxin reductase family protein [Micromonosporaceae bacterium]
MHSVDAAPATVWGPPTPRNRAWQAHLAIAAAWFTVAVVVGMWLFGSGLQGLNQEGGPATSLGRITGLLSADLLLIQVLLMARIPWLERWYGQDRLARWHRQVGFTSFWLMLAHIFWITIGYASTQGIDVVRMGWQLTFDYPGMLLAVAGSALLVGVVVLSIRAARRRLRYESWHLLHLYAYLGIGLSIPHEIWTGSDFTTSALAQAYWWTLYAVALAAVLVFRVGLPLWRSSYHRLRVHAVTKEAPGVVSVYLRGRRLDRLQAKAGQFFLWRFLDGPGWSRAHPFTLSAAPRSHELRITVKNLGDGSARIARLRRGTRALIEGPMGAVTAERRRRRKVLLIAAGVGITLIRSILDELVVAPGDVTVLYRVRDARRAVFRREFDAFAHERGDRVFYLDGPRWRHGGWLPANLAHLGGAGALLWLVPDVLVHDVFVCGPPEWMDSVIDSLAEVGVPEDQIHREEFTW